MQENENQAVDHAIDNAGADDNLVQLKPKTDYAKSIQVLSGKLAAIEKVAVELGRVQGLTDARFVHLTEQNKDFQNETEENLTATSAKLKDLHTDYGRLASQSKILTAETAALATLVHENKDALDTDVSQLRERAESSDARARQLRENLEAKVTVLHSTIEAVETRLREEIAAVAKAAEERAAKLAEETQRLREADEVLRARASVLEDRTEGLEGRSSKLEGRASILETLTAKLTKQTTRLESDGELLGLRASVLEETARDHQGQVSALAGTVRNHFHGFSGVLILVVLAIAGIALYANHDAGVMQANHETQVAADQMLAQKIFDQNAATLATQQNLSNDIASLDNSLSEQQQSMLVLQERVQAIQEKTDTVSGRVSAVSSFTEYGIDNVVHGANWISVQQSDAVMIHFATVATQADIYHVADRWSSFLKDYHLSYVKQQNQGQQVFDVFYGPFKTVEEANTVLRTLPAPDLYKRPSIVTVVSVQQAIAAQ